MVYNITWHKPLKVSFFESILPDSTAGAAY